MIKKVIAYIIIHLITIPSLFSQTFTLIKSSDREKIFEFNLDTSKLNTLLSKSQEIDFSILFDCDHLVGF
jgi:hypothetical protein